MKKTLTINLGGFIFHIDEDAFNQLDRYLATLRSQFSRTSGADEIIADVETRMAELFRERNSETKEVINTQDVEAVISILGKPEDYLQEEDYANADTNFNQYQSYSKKIHRDVDNRIIGGVAAGLAAYLNIDSIWTRLLFIALLFTGFGALLYIILWIVVPSARTTAEKLQMRGKPVTLSNIENFVREEAHAVGDSVKNMGRKAQNLNRNSSSLASLLSRFFDGLFQIIRLILKFAFKVIGFIFLIGVFIALASLAATLLIGFNLDNTHYTWSEISNLFQLVSTDNSLYNSITLGFSLFVIGPLFLLVYYGIRLVFGVDPLNRGVRRGLGFLSLIGLIILGSSAYELGRSFQAESYYTSEQKINFEIGTYNIVLAQDDIYQSFYEGMNTDIWTIHNGKSYYKGIELDIRKSDKDYSYVETEFRSRGINRESARKNAQNLNYIFKTDSNQLVFSNYYGINEGSFYRLQKIDHTLYMIPGDTIYLSPGTENLIYYVKNLNNYWDNNMDGHYWTMTEAGLLCVDCENSDDIWENTINEVREIEGDIQENVESSGKVRIENDLIIIEESEANLFPFHNKNEGSIKRLIAVNETSLLI